MNKEICILLDTNIWVYASKMLRSDLGCALLFEIKKNNIKIMLPEVVELEVRKHIIKHGMESVKNIINGLSTVEKLSGNRYELSLPNECVFSDTIEKRFDELKDLIKREKYTIEDAKNALVRVMDELPPNGLKNQQYKDSCIWETIKRTSNECEIHFVTEDNAFFENKSGNIPQKIFTDEMEKMDAKVFFYRSVIDFLKIITKDTPTINYEEILKLINKRIDKDKILDSLMFCYTLDVMETGNITAFYTENPDKLILQFEVLYNASYQLADEDVSGIGFVKVVGETSYITSKKNITKINFSSIQLLNSQKEEIYKAAFGRVSVNIGISSRTQPYSNQINIDALKIY